MLARSGCPRGTVLGMSDSRTSLEHAPASGPLELEVDFPRLQRDVESLALIGQDPGDHGIHRPAFSDAFEEAQCWLEARAAEAGLSVRRDGANNVILRHDNHRNQRAVMCGSHLDSIPGGGPLDGALGVVAGLEALRRVKELDLPLRCALECVAFTDEEGRFGAMFGSQAMSGRLSAESIASARDLSGVNLVDVMRARGLEPVRALQAARPREAVRAFVELHIEQGPLLEQAAIPVGVVEDIVGLFKWRVSLRGEANHAGTTPMHLRLDAFQGLAEFAGEINRVLEEHGSETSVATIGRVELIPGAPNVVPGLVVFSLESRDSHPDVLAELANGFRRTLSAVARRRKLEFDVEILSEIDPVGCDPEIIKIIERSAKRLGLASMRMPSGAAHDAQMISEITPVGMIFVPSKGGRSHHPSESTAWQDIRAGANVLLNTLYELAR